MKKSKRHVKMLSMGLAVCMTASAALSAKVATVKAEDIQEDTGWNDIQDVISRYYGEWNDTNYSGLSNQQMPNTALLGNGDVGVSSAGNSKEKKFYVSKGDFWVYGTTGYSHEAGMLSLGGVTIREKEKKEDGTNLALDYKNVSASSVLNVFTPDKAVNGTMSDANDMWCTQIGKEHWLTLEFDTPITFSRWVVKFDEALRPGLPDIGANTASDFQLQISETGEADSWTDVSNIIGNSDAVFDENLAEAVTAKYVRINFTKPTQETTADSKKNPRARVAEFELYAETKEQEETDLALNKPVEVSSQWSGEAKGTLVDGNDGTQWTSSGEAKNAEEHWAVIDLEEEKNIGYWVLKNSTETGCATSDFKLQYSNDKERWTDFAVIEGNAEYITAETLENPINTRYVRLSITKATQTDNSYARIRELELYENYVEPAEPFYEKQDILNAEIQTRQEIADLNTEMTTWVASDKNVMVTELEAKGNRSAEFEVETWATNSESNIRPITAVNDDTSVTVTRSSENRHPDDPEAWISKAALSTTVIGADITEAASDMASGKGALNFTLQPNEKVYVVTAIGGGGRTYTNEGALWEAKTEPDAEAQELLGEVSSENAVQELNTERQNWWKNYWSASYVDFGTDDEKLNQIQKYYYGAQYILGSTVREGKKAPGLYGVWRVTDNPLWHGDYHLNYNFMATFYGVNSSNRAALSLPAAEALFDFVSNGEKRAASTAELREINSSIVDKNIAEGDIDPVNGIADAILFPLGIGPWGSAPNDKYLNECLAAGYNSYLFTQYYDYTLDESILDQAYDYLKKCANFYEAWLVKEDGRYNMYGGWCEAYQGKNPAIELATMQNVFKNVISMSETLGADEEKRPVWEEIYEDISIKPTWTAKGKTIYGLAEKRMDGSGGETDLGLFGQLYSNVVMLDYFLPGDSLGYFSSPEELQIARDTIDTFDSNSAANTAWNNKNNFPRIYADAVRARYDVNQIIDHLYQNVSGGKMAANLRIVDDMHGVEKSGTTEAINSMMLLSDKGITKIFPNWYADKDAKFVNLRAKGAFTVSAEYDGAAQEAKNVVINSEKGETMTFVSPWAEGATVRDSQGNVVKTEAGTVPNREDEKTITFATTAGETYTVEKGEAPVELDYEAIDKVIAEAEAIKQDGYTQESYQALQDALKSARDARQNATTQDELNQKKDGLRTAIDGLKGSKNVLETFLNRAKQHVANGDVDGLVESVQKLFAEAIAEGEAIMEKEDASKEDVLGACVKLMKAIQALDMEAGDKADLGMALELTNMIDLTKYVEAGQEEYLAAKAAAEDVMENGDAMQPEVNAAWTTLVDTMMDLRLKADKAALSDLLESLKDLDLNKYTEESVRTYNDALALANTIMNDDGLSVDDQPKVDEAVVTLMAAKDGLTEKKGSGDANKDKPNGNGSQNNNGQNSNGNSQNGNGTQNKGSANQGIKTGDAAIVFVPIIGIMLSFGAAAVAVSMFFRRKRR